MRLPAAVRRSVAAALALGAAAIVAVSIAGAQTAHDPAAYTYALAVDIDNTSSTPWMGPIPVAMNTGALLSGGYVSSTGADILFTDSSHNRTGGIAQDMNTSATSSWLWFADVPANTNGSVRAFMDGPPAQALFPLGAGSDRIEVPDEASLDVTDHLTLQAAAYLHAIPSQDQATIAGKASAYRLGVRNGNEVFGTVSRCCSTLTLYPNGAGDFENIIRRAGCSAGSHWQCLTATANTSTAYVSNNLNYVTDDSYALDNPSLPAGAEIVSVTVYHRSKRVGTATPHWARPLLRLGGAQANGVTSTTAYGTGIVYSSNLTNSRPGGGLWSPSDLANLQAGIALYRSSTSELYVVVEYSTIMAEVSHSPVSAGRVYELKLTRDDPALTLYVDGVAQATASAAGTISASSAPLVIGEGITGGVGNVKVCHTSISSPTCALDLRFEGADIEPTQNGSATNGWQWRGSVDDRSADNNDGAYYITTQDPGMVAVTVNALRVRPQALPPLPQQPAAAVAPGPHLEVFATPQSSGIVSSPFIDPVRELVNRGALPAHAFWMILSTIVAAVVSGKVLNSALGSMLWAAVAGGLVYFAMAYVLGIPLAFVALVALAYFGALGLVKFAQ